MFTGKNLRKCKMVFKYTILYRQNFTNFSWSMSGKNMFPLVIKQKIYEGKRISNRLESKLQISLFVNKKLQSFVRVSQVSWRTYGFYGSGTLGWQNDPEAQHRRRLYRKKSVFLMSQSFQCNQKKKGNREEMAMVFLLNTVLPCWSFKVS